MHRVALTLLVGLMAVSVSQAAPSGTPSQAKSGLRGLVTLSPIRPVCIEGRPCSKPAARVLLVFRRGGDVAARVTTGKKGWYRVLLRPGRYTVASPRVLRGSGVSPRVVRVWKGRISRVDLDIDTGIQ